MLDAPIIRHRVASLDVLRGLLAIWVMFAHAVPWAVFYQNEQAVSSAAVDLAAFARYAFQTAGETNPAVLAFIVLSGYCIHRAGLRNADADIGSYAIRRLFRIYPVYLVAIFAGVVAWSATTTLLVEPGTVVGGTKEITAGCVAARITAFAAFYPPLHQCVFLGNAPLSTVMVEMTLYAAYPLLLFGLARRYGEGSLWLSIVAVWLVGVVAITLAPSLRPWWHNGSFFGFLLYWWVGAKALEPKFRVWLSCASWAILGTWMLMTALLILDAPLSAGIAEVRKVAFAALVAFLIVRLDQRGGKPRVLSALGVAGYSLYAFHAPVIYPLIHGGVPWWGAIALAVVVGLTGYVLIERPGIAIGRSTLRQRRVATQQG